MLRKVFNYNNLNESKTVDSKKLNTSFPNPISACSCLLYKVVKNVKYLLLISYEDPNWPNLDDFGGRVEDDDDNVYDTISRETAEESNDIIVLTQEQLENSKHKFYVKQSKCYSVLLQVPENFHKDTKIFGDFENKDKIYRVINWYEYNDDLKERLSFRIKGNKKLLECLDN